MNNPAQLYPGSTHPIPVRRPELDFSDSIPRFWFMNNPVVTHSFNAFNLLIPESEHYFVRSVKNFKHLIRDPALRQQIKGFTAQESLHAKAHEDYFEWMKRKGYRLDRYLKILRAYIKFSERMGTAKYNLAATAAAEHYTAAIGTLLLTEPKLVKDMDPTMKRFITWHSVEEIEHKAVAFDILKIADVSNFTRLLAYIIVSFDILLFTSIGILMLSRQDGISALQMYHYKRAFRKEVPGVSKRFRKMIFAYFRSDFHPNQTDNLAHAHHELEQTGIKANSTERIS